MATVDGLVTVDAVDKFKAVEDSDLLEVDDSEVVVSAAATPARRASTRDDNLMVKGVACVYPEREEEEGAVLTSDLERIKRVRSQVGGLQWMLFFFVSAWREVPSHGPPRPGSNLQQIPGPQAGTISGTRTTESPIFGPTRVWWGQAQR